MLFKRADKLSFTKFGSLRLDPVDSHKLSTGAVCWFST